MHRIFTMIDGFLAANDIISNKGDFKILSVKFVAGCNYVLPEGKSLREEYDAVEVEFKALANTSLCFQDFINYYKNCVCQFLSFQTGGEYEAVLKEKREYFKEVNQKRMFRKTCPCLKTDCKNSGSMMCNKY